MKWVTSARVEARFVHHPKEYNRPQCQMESLTPAQRAVLTTAHNAGRVPHHTKSRTILATGAGAAAANRRYVVLANHAGLTPHGKAWYEHTAEEPPDRRIDMTQTPSRVGNSEYAVDRQGRRQRLRTLMPTGDFKYTAYGNHFFSRRQVEFGVHVPVIVEAFGATERPIDIQLICRRLC